MRNLNLALASFSLLVSSIAFAEPVEFTTRELDAAYVLAHPEKSSIVIDGRQGTFVPAPALRYLGLEKQVFDIDLKFIADLVDLRFANLRGKMPGVTFTNGAFSLNVPVEDNAKAIRSSLGAIGFKGASITATLEWKRLSNGSQVLGVKSVVFNGKLSGTGVLRGSFALSQTKKLMVKTLTNEIQKILGRAKVQEQIARGLVTWANMNQDEAFTAILAGSLQFFTEGGVSGVRYEAVR